jgi:hypothetical protein
VSTRVHESPYHTIDYVEGGTFAVVVRTDTAWPSEAAIHHEMVKFANALQLLPTHRVSLLIDLRTSPARNDQEFERVFGPLRTRALTGFRRLGFLVRTQVGAMQLQRLAREDGLDARTFSDEGQALGWAQS